MLVRSRLHLTVLGCCFLAGCHSAPLAGFTRESLVGNYVYRSEDPENKATDHELDHLTLQSDGKYDLVEGGSTKAKSEEVGAWHFTGAELLLDYAGYPVRVERGEIRLQIDDDVGIWFAKVN